MTTTSEAQLLLNRWCINALTYDRGKQQNGMMPGTVHGYLGCLCEHVFQSGDAIVTMNAEDLINHLDARLSSIEGDARRAKTLKAVRSFYRFLRQVRIDLPPLPPSFQDYEMDQRASANFLSPEEFVRALQSCRSSDQRIALILGFRCGLRLPEVLGLTIHDFYVSRTAFELTLIRNDHRDLKTPTSRRVLPLHILLNDDEASLLKTRIAEKVRDFRAAPGKDLLITKDDLCKGFNDTKSVKRAFEMLLHDATGVNLTFHHLRHSFSSYLTATMLLPSDHRGAPIPDALKDVISFERKSRLEEALLGSEKLGQHALHAVSLAMGHIVPRTTIDWYCHLLDISLLHYVARPIAEAALPRNEVLALVSRDRPAKQVSGAGPSIPTSRKTKSGYRRPSLVSDNSAVECNRRLLRVSTQRGSLALRWEQKFVNPSRIADRKTTPVLQDEASGPEWRSIVAVLTNDVSNGDQTTTECFAWRNAAHAIFSLQQKSGAPRHSLKFSKLKSPKWVAYLDSRWSCHRSLSGKERRALFFAIENWDPSRDGVRFSGRPMAVAFFGLLRGFDFVDDEIGFKLTGQRFKKRSTEGLHGELATADDLPGCARTRKRRGTIGIHLKGAEPNERHVRSVGHFLLVLLAIREGYALSTPASDPTELSAHVA